MRPEIPDVITLAEETDERNEAERKQLVRDVQKVCSLPEGERFIHWIFDMFPFNRELYTKNADTYYFLGQWSVTRTIMNLLCDAVPDFVSRLFLRKEFNSGQRVNGNQGSR